MKNTLTAVDFGTSKISVLVADSGNRQRNCDILGAGYVEYAGYTDGQWNDPDNLIGRMSEAVHKAEEQSGIRIREVSVGVPGEFCRVYTVEARVDLQGTDPHVTQNDVRELFNEANRQLGAVQGEIIHRGPAWFKVDEGKKTLEPMGVRGNSLRAKVSYVVADGFFLNDVSERFRAINVQVASFFSTSVGQSMMYVPIEERVNTAVAVDIGYLNTEVMVIEGDAIIYQQVLPVGGGYISADLAYGLKIPLESAETIKRSYTFGTYADEEETYDVPDRDNVTRTFTREEVAEVLEPRVEEICEKIHDTIKGSGVRLSNQSVVFITGGGLALNRGAREMMSKKLDRTVRDFPRKTNKLSSPLYTSVLGLMDTVLENSEMTNQPRGLRGMLRNLFGG